MKTNNSDIEEASDPDVTTEIEELFDDYQKGDHYIMSCRCCLHCSKIGPYNYCDKNGVYFYDGDAPGC